MRVAPPPPPPPRPRRRAAIPPISSLPLLLPNPAARPLRASVNYGAGRGTIMVHVRKVEIFGFKSFGYRNTVVEMRPGLVALAGSNGSGKSNILDAITFATGENKPKIMRVGRMSELLHDAGGTRPPRGRGKPARVSVHLDNSDRRIPVDSDTVEISRELDDSGESVYYLNKKKAARGQVVDLLDVASARLHQLNAVRQNTIASISNFTPEEKRRSIEDLIGLSEFDERKEKALKELDDADRRLEVALAKMDEIKKQIDELDAERNLKLRHDMLGAEVRRLNAVSASRRLAEIESERSAKLAEDEAIGSRINEARDKRDTARARAAEIEEQKSDYMNQLDVYNEKKSAVESELSSALRKFEEAEAGLLTAKNAVRRIDEALPRIRGELADAEQGASEALEGAARARGELADAESEAAAADGRAAEASRRRDAALERQAEAVRAMSERDEEARRIAERRGEARLAAAGSRARLADAEARARENAQRHGQYEEQHAKLLGLRERLESVRKNHAASVRLLGGKIAATKSERDRTVREIDDLSMLLEKSASAGSRFEAKIRLVKDIMHEDYSAAKLRENAGRLGLIGLAYELLRWDKKHERAVLAASSDWLKATVVRDFATLVGLAEFVRDRRLPKLKIIPLDALPDVSMGELPAGQGVLGVLSDLVQCAPEHSRLRSFLFGSIVVAASKDDAYALSRRGYRAVTADGEFFESNAAAVVVDVNSRISKLTKIISMSASVDGLIRSTALLRGHLERKKASLRRLDSDLDGQAQRLEVSRGMLAEADHGLDDLAWQTGQRSSMLGRLAGRLAELSSERDRLRADAEKHESYAASLDAQAAAAAAAPGAAPGAALDAIASELKGLDAERREAEKARAAAAGAYGRAAKKAADLEADATAGRRRAETLRAEEGAASSERRGHESRMADLAAARDGAERLLAELREREQDVLASGGKWASTIKDYDGALSELNGRDRALSRDISSCERASDSLRRDLDALGEEEGRLRAVIARAGFGPAEAAEAAEAAGEHGAGAGDAAQIVRDLEAELRSLGDLNAKAPESYARVSEGYRSMSSRKNELESERNKIVEFIESVDKGKRQTFLDAFDRVDKEVRAMFSAMMDGGNAWLELENEDDVFSSGVLYMLQFPHKPKRESVSISGGEQTLAAVVYTLALQQLRPSPFYLFDEIDASLDGQNAKRLADILRERSRSSQFVMVSHKDLLVAQADVVYGVFPKAGVSQVVRYNRRGLPARPAA